MPPARLYASRSVFRAAACRLTASFLAAPLAATLVIAAPARADEATVFAAASLKTALDEIAADWQAQTGDRLKVSYAGSSTLARQIEQGAPADLFISANVGWMDELEDAGLIKTDTRLDLLGNSIVLIAHDPETPRQEITSELDLAGLLDGGRLAMAMVDAVPAGIYGKASLISLGLWDGVKAQVAQADNVRAALALVATGEAPLGIVYATDAVAEDRVSVLGTFPPDSHPAIVYPAALTADSRSDAAAQFLAWLTGPEAAAVFATNGFRVPD